MVVQILPVIDRSLLDLSDGRVDFMDGVFFFVTQMAPVWPFQMCARVAQIRQRVQISGMLALGKRAAAAEGKKQRKYHGRNENASNCFHGLVFSWC